MLAVIVYRAKGGSSNEARIGIEVLKIGLIEGISIIAQPMEGWQWRPLIIAQPM
jgi:hypothetical protein